MTDPRRIAQICRRLDEARKCGEMNTPPELLAHKLYEQGYSGAGVEFLSHAAEDVAFLVARMPWPSVRGIGTDPNRPARSLHEVHAETIALAHALGLGAQVINAGFGDMAIGRGVRVGSPIVRVVVDDTSYDLQTAAELIHVLGYAVTP